MDYNRGIVVISEGDNHSKLTTQLEPIRLSQNRGLAVKSIFHGPVFNIDRTNNHIHYKIPKISERIAESNINQLDEKHFQIPEGNYPTTLSVLEAISSKFNEVYPPGSRIPSPKFEIIQTRRKDFIRITTSELIIIVSNRRGTPWSMLTIFKDIIHAEEIKVKNNNFSEWVSPSFLYVNIVESSYINGRLSRNLSTLPLQMKNGWSYYEFPNPVYSSINVQEFSKILLEIRDIYGNYITFDPSFKTILNLHIKAINTTE